MSSCFQQGQKELDGDFLHPDLAVSSPPSWSFVLFLGEAALSVGQHDVLGCFSRFTT
jgi:hypothetical protein